MQDLLKIYEWEKGLYISREVEERESEEERMNSVGEWNEGYRDIERDWVRFRERERDRF